MALKTQAEIIITLSSLEEAEAVYQSLKPETKPLHANRSEAKIEPRNKTLLINLEAKDTIALRAALNSYLRWIMQLAEIHSVIINTKHQKDEKRDPT